MPPIPGSRAGLNTNDPRVSGTVTYFSFDDRLDNTGNTGGTPLDPAYFTTFVDNPSDSPGNMLRMPGGITAAQGTGITAATMGIDAAKPRTVFCEYYHYDSQPSVPLFGVGAGETHQDYYFLKNNWNNIQLNHWTDDLIVPVNQGWGNYITRFVARYDGTTVKLAVRVCKTDTSDANPVGWKPPQFFTQSVALNTPASAQLHVNYSAADVSSGTDAGTSIAYFGIVGNQEWTDEQVDGFLYNPEVLWTASAASVGTAGSDIVREDNGYRLREDGFIALREALDATFPITGTIEAVSNSSGTLVGKGKLLGSSAATSASASTLRGKLAIIAYSQAYTDSVGSLKGLAKLNGSSVATSNSTGLLSANAGITGTSAAVSNSTGTLKGKGSLLGSISTITDSVGSLKGLGTLSGTSAAVSGSSGTVVSRAGLTGFVVASSDSEGTLNGIGLLTGLSNALSNSNGSLTALSAGDLIGSIQALSDSYGTLNAKGILTGLSEVISDSDGILVGSVSQNSYKLRREDNGFILRENDTFIDLEAYAFGTGPLSGTISAISGSSGTLFAKTTLRATTYAYSNSFAILRAAQKLSALTVSYSNSYGSLRAITLEDFDEITNVKLTQISNPLDFKLSFPDKGNPALVTFNGLKL